MAVAVKPWKVVASTNQQYDFSCCSAALATLLSHHYAFAVTERAVFEEMYAQGDQHRIRQQGFSLLDMQRFLAVRGFHADGFQLPLEKLIEARVPAIALVSDQDFHHFVVIKGLAGGRVLIGDPSKGARAVSVEQLRELRIGKNLFVIHGYQ